MPNWCYNSLTIGGAPTEVIMAAILLDGEFSFNAWAPMPEELRDLHTGACTINGQECNVWRGEGEEKIPVDTAPLLEKYGAKDWYDWACYNWGTKWDASDVDVSIDRGVVYVDFSTAWGPPTEALDKLFAKYPQFRGALAWSGEADGYRHEVDFPRPV